MTTPYRDLSLLVLENLKGLDYEIVFQNRSSPIAVVAIHGGYIEPLTSELAQAVAAEDCSVYEFQGLKPGGSETLRVPVSRFEEMRLQGLLEHCHTALSIDGVPGDDLLVHVGGRNRHLREALTEQLQAAQFEVGPPAGPGAAHSPSRFYNQTKLGGVHLELPLALRREMVHCELPGGPWKDPQRWGEPFHRFVGAVRQALSAYLETVAVDLDLTMERFEKATRAFPTSLRRPDDNHQH